MTESECPLCDGKGRVPWQGRVLHWLGGLCLLLVAAWVLGTVMAWATCGLARSEAEGRFLRPDGMPRDMVRAARERAGQDAYDRCYRERWWAGSE